MRWGLRGRWWEESSLSKNCLASEVQAKHHRLPPDPGKQAFALQKLGLQVPGCVPESWAPGQEEPTGHETEAVGWAQKSTESDEPRFSS